MKTILWAVSTCTLDICGRKDITIEVRQQKTPHLNMVYRSLTFHNFHKAAEWARGKNVILKFARQLNRWDNEAMMMLYGKVIEIHT